MICLIEIMAETFFLLVYWLYFTSIVNKSEVRMMQAFDASFQGLFGCCELGGTL